MMLVARMAGGPTEVLPVKKLLAAAGVLGTLSCDPIVCVARGARVRTPRGERPIEDLEVGDTVLCVDPEQQQLVAAEISLVRSARRECIELRGEGVVLTVTSDHPLYCPETKQWAPAGDWALGRRTQLLRVSAESMAPVRITGVSTFAGLHDVFDLTVDHPLHNFIANGLLVHNKQNTAYCYPDQSGDNKFDGQECVCGIGPTRGKTVCTDVSKHQGYCDCPDAGSPDGGP